MIRVLEIATEDGNIVYKVQFDDHKGQLHELVVSIPVARWSEELAKERIMEAVERERARLVLEEARALEGAELELEFEEVGS